MNNKVVINHLQSLLILVKTHLNILLFGMEQVNLQLNQNLDKYTIKEKIIGNKVLKLLDIILFLLMECDLI